MLELLLKYVGQNVEVTNEKNLHYIVQDMSEFCQPSTKLAKVREAVAKNSLISYILNTGMNLRDKEKVSKLRELNKRFDNSTVADAKLSFMIAQKFKDLKIIDCALDYLEKSISHNYAKESIKYLLDWIKNGEINITQIPNKLLQSAFLSDLEPKQLSDLISIVLPKNDNIDFLSSPSSIVLHLKMSAELNNEISNSIISNKLPTDSKMLWNSVENIIDSNEISDNFKYKLVSRISQNIAVCKSKVENEEFEKAKIELLQKVEEIKDSYNLLTDIKLSLKSTEEKKDKIDDKKFIKDNEYRKKIIDQNAKLMIGMNVLKTALLKHIDADEYVIIAISGLFEKQLSLENLTTECDLHLNTAKSDPKNLILTRILPVCTKNEHFLYCIKKISTGTHIKMYDLLNMVHEILPIQFFYNFGPNFNPSFDMKNIPENTAEFIKNNLIINLKNEANSGYIEKLYYACYANLNDSNFYLHLNLLRRIQEIHCEEIQPNIIWPLWLLKKFDWIRPQTGIKRNKFMRDSMQIAYDWVFSNITENLSFGEIQEILWYCEMMFKYESKIGPGALPISVISKFVHSLLKSKKITDHKLVNSGFLIISEIVYQIYKIQDSFEREKICNFIAKNSIEKLPLDPYLIINYAILNIPNSLQIVLKTCPEELKSLLKISEFLQNSINSQLEFLTTSIKIPEIPYFYQLDSLNLNEKLHLIIQKWDALKMFVKYIDFLKIASPDLISPALRNIWENTTDITVKRIFIILFESLLSEIYGKIAIAEFLFKNAQIQLKIAPQSIKIPKNIIEVFDFIREYEKNKGKEILNCEECCELLSYAIICSKFVENKEHKGIFFTKNIEK